MVTTGRDQKHFTVPVFIPGAACPFQCIFCDQKKISGASGIPSQNDVNEIIRRHLQTIPFENVFVEVGFFGGTFTGLRPEQQQRFFDVVYPYIRNGRIKSIRVSTRPDFITPEILSLLRKNFVGTIELGAQSMDDEVLLLSSRGHDSADTESASRLIIEAGFSLGLQMMIGLPGDTAEKAVETARGIVALKAMETRIYPVLVIRGTKLEEMYLSGQYQPLALDEAVHRTKDVVKVFESSAVKILRIGLHPSEELVNRTALVAGPFHPSFRELVMTERWNDRFRSGSLPDHADQITINVNPADYNNAIGYSGKNRKFFETRYRQVKFISDPEIPQKSYHVDYR